MKINLGKRELIHFIGIGGIGMSGLSLVMKGKKFKVQGSDITLNKNIEKIFKVNVVKVNIINKKSILKFTRGRNSRVKGFKKAIVTLKKGQSIDLTTGI